MSENYIEVEVVGIWKKYGIDPCKVALPDLEPAELADRLATLHFNSCTCDELTSHHPPSCPTAIIDDCCSFLRALAARRS